MKESGPLKSAKHAEHAWQRPLIVAPTLGTVTSLTESSDRRLKENIKPLKNSLSKVLNLEGVSFNRKITPQEPEIGFIAQDVRKVVPEIVKEDDEGMLSVSYSKTVALLVEGMKEQQKMINKLQQEIQELKN